MSLIRMLSFVVCCLSCCSVSLAIDEDSPLPSALRPINIFAWSTIRVKIVDADGAPIPRARVRFRHLSAHRGYGWWSDVVHGVPPIAISDEEGLAEVQYPKSIHPVHQYEVKGIQLLATHSEYCLNTKHFDFSVKDEAAEIRLEPGVKLRVAGVTPGSDQPLPHCHLLVEGNSQEFCEFVRDESGWLNSVTVSRDRRWFRVVYQPVEIRGTGTLASRMSWWFLDSAEPVPVISTDCYACPGEPVQFSQLQAWNPDEAPQGGLRVMIQPGVRVIGRMPEEIPRPISRGRVAVSCGSVLRNNEENGQNENPKPVWWHDVADVRPDGSFEFASLPSGHIGQFFAFADDWVSAQPSDEAFQMLSAWYPKDTRKPGGWFRYGQVLRLAGRSQQLKLKMEQAGLVKVRCFDQNRQPLRGILVGFWPNHIVLGGGGGIFCEYRSTRDLLEGRPGKDFLNGNPFHANSDRDGIAIVRSIPADEQSILVGTDPWSGVDIHWGVFPELDDANNRIRVRAGETQELEYQLKPLN